MQLILLGGEPLIWRPQQRERVKSVVDYVGEAGWELEIVTNGADLLYYIPLLDRNVVTMIQTTIDGPKEFHDRRRVDTQGKGTFERIVASIDAALEAGPPIAVRVNVDDQNVYSLPELAKFFESRGWFTQPRFGCYLGLTYDLHETHPYTQPAHITLKKILEVRKAHPLTRRLSLETWEPLMFLMAPLLRGEPCLPKFVFCGAQRNSWCLDLHGDVYLCANSVGRKEFAIGRFLPRLELDEECVGAWHRREVDSRLGCRTCKVRHCCGGGCQFRRAFVRPGSNRGCLEGVYPMMRVALEYYHHSPEVFTWPTR